MVEADSSLPRLPAEAAVLGTPEEGLVVVEAGPTDEAALEQRMYDALIKQRTMALGLTMAGARTRDGLYTAWAYNATATAGLLRELLERQDTDNARALLERLRDEDVAREENTGNRQVF
jgi:hypothetical protein